MKLHRNHEPDTDGIEEQANKAFLLAALLDLFRKVELFKISLTRGYCTNCWSSRDAYYTDCLDGDQVAAFRYSIAHSPSHQIGEIPICPKKPDEALVLESTPIPEACPYPPRSSQWRRL